MAEMLSPEADSAVRQRNRAAQTMASRLAQTGSGRYTPEVESFQSVWNQTLWATREQLRLIGYTSKQANSIAYTLAVDGLYGRNTSNALYALVGDPRPPITASGMPTWAATNQSTLAQLVPPGGPPVQDVINPEVTIDTNPDVRPNSGGQVVVSEIDGATTSGPRDPDPIPIDLICEPHLQLPSGCAFTGDGGYICDPGVTYQQLRASGCLTQAEYDAMVANFEAQVAQQAPTPANTYEPPVTYIEPGTDIPIVTTRPGSSVPAAAILVGVGVLGGAFWWMRSKKGRRAFA